MQGFVQANGNGSLTVGCYLYDVSAGTELARQGYVVQPRDWRRAAHRCADTIYSRLTGEGAYFDTRIVYVSETGPARHRIKRLAIMDYDGANHRFLTNGQWTVLTPRFAPNQQTITFMTYQDERPRVMVYELDSGRTRPLVAQPYMTFAPRYSPDSRHIIFSMAVNGNTDIYRIPVGGRHAAAAHQFAGHRHRRLLFAGRQPDRVRKRPRRQPAALRDERRRLEPAPDQLRRRRLCDAGLEPARRPHRLHPHRRRSGSA